MNRFRTLLLMTLIALHTIVPAAAQNGTPALSFQITDIPLLTNAKASVPEAINSGGQVAGRTTQIASSSTAYLGWVWTPAAGTSPAKIESLAPLSGLPHSDARDINDVGIVAGTSHLYVNTSGNSRATLWLKGQYASPIDLNADPLKQAFLPGWVLTEGRSVSNPDPTSGYYYVACVGDFTNTDGTVKHFVGAVLTMQDKNIVSAARLRYPENNPIDPWNDSLVVNTAGRVSGVYLGDVVYAACIWNATDGSLAQAFDLQTLDPYAMNEDSILVGQTGSFAFISAPSYGTVDSLTTLLTGTDAGSTTIAYGSNNATLSSGAPNMRRQIVGQVTYKTSSVRAACLWQLQLDTVTAQPKRDAAGKLLYYFYDLNKCSITIPSGTTVTVTRLVNAKGINDSGWIIGSGTTKTGSNRACLLKPTN